MISIWALELYGASSATGQIIYILFGGKK